MFPVEVQSALAEGRFDSKITYLCGCTPEQLPDCRRRIINAVSRFASLYGSDRDVFVFSAPGRTELGGNHTDHQQGCVLAASINLDVLAVVALRKDSTLRLHSHGYPAEDVLDVSDPLPREEERHTSAGLIRGMIHGFLSLGYALGGLDIYTTSDVLTGSGLSSSAAFEVLIGTIFSQMFCSDQVSALKIAQIGQQAENDFFGKPCGLMDQAASSIGGFVSIDFADPRRPKVEKINFDFTKSGYSLCILNTRGSHAGLTPDYAAIPEEMGKVAAFFGKTVLREVDEAAFFTALPQLREQLGDRPVLRAIHFFADNRRAPQEAAALKRGDFAEFMRLVLESGQSSCLCLQNIYSIAHPQEQGLSIGLALCEHLLKGRGAWRVHGGGFAGTVQAFAPLELTEEFRQAADAVFGSGSCCVLNVRPIGGARIV